MNANKKQAYDSPRMSVVLFQSKDIITTSGAGGFFGEEDAAIELPIDALF